MAATLIKTQAFGTSSDYFLKLYIEETTNATANTSSVTVSLYGYTERPAEYCSWNNEGTNSINVIIDGTTSTLSNQNIDTSTWRTGSGKLLHSYTKTVAHNSDGTKTIAVAGYINYSGGGSSLPAGTYSTGSVSQTLTPIARASKVGTVSGNTINSTSGNLTINLTKGNVSYYDRITTTGAVSTTVNVGTGTSGTIAWSTILNAMTTTASATLNITVSTYSSSSYAASALVGTSTGTATVTINTSAVKPTVSWGAISANSNGLSGNLVAGRSTAKATWSVSGLNGASVSSVAISATNITGGVGITIASGATSTSTTGTPTTAALMASSTSSYQIRFTATVTDSRGATATANTATATVYPYKKPVVTLTAYRTATNSSKVEDPAGTYVYVKYTRSVSSVNGANSIASTTTSPSGLATEDWITLAAGSSRTISVTVTDTAGGSTTAQVQIPTASVPLSLYSNVDGTSVGVGIGGAAQAGKFTVSLPTYHNNDLYLNGNTTTPVGTVISASSSLTSIATGTYTNVCSMSLTKGTWVVAGQFQCTGSAAFRVITSIATSTGSGQPLEGGYAIGAATTSTVSFAQNVVRILTVTGASQTVYLIANQNSGSAKAMTEGQSLMRAVCIA